jgi:DNA gyrase subunit B
LAYTNSKSASKIDLAAYIVMDQNKNLTWVNSNFASLGGSPIEYLENRLCDEVRKKAAIRTLEKKLKTQATRNDVRACFHMVINLKILNPRFKSQDKSYLINDLNAEIREAVDKNLDKLLRRTDLIERIKNQMEKRTHLKALEDANKKIKKASRITIPKFIPPTGRPSDGERTLFIAEGDSAIAGLRPVRDPKFHGLFPLRGKPMNVRGMSLAKAMSNEELKNVVAIIGLPMEGKVKSINELNFERVSIITDADFDGYAIRSLMLSFFYEYWPELFDLGFVHITAAPLYEVELAKNGKKELKFCIDDAEYEALEVNLQKSQTKMVRKKRNKGLGETSKPAMRFAVQNCIKVIKVKNTKSARNMQRLWFQKDYASQRRQAISEYAMKFYEE